MDKPLMKIRHERSKKDFPSLKLEDDEYVEFALKRARIYLWLIWARTALLAILLLLALLLMLVSQQGFLDAAGANYVFVVMITVVVVVLLSGVVATIVHNGNRLFITNQHVIQMTMNSPVSSSYNVINLESVEDVSFRQNTVAEKLFHYGTLRLSTVGDESTYTFRRSDISRDDLNAVSKLVSDAKQDD